VVSGWPKCRVRALGEEEGIFTVSALGGHERKLAQLNLPFNWGQYERRRLLQRPHFDEMEFQKLEREADWSPDGRFLAVPDEPPDEQPGIFLISAQAGTRRRLTYAPSSHYDALPTFSPDGRSVAFVRAAGPNQDIYLADINGGEPKRLSFLQRPVGGAFSWTTDGNEILFSSLGEESHFSLWRISVRDGTLDRIAMGGTEDALSPVLSREGNRLAYREISTNVIIWRLETPSLHRRMPPPLKLISSTRWQSAQEFTPDGSKIVFASNRSGSAEIWVCDADGSNPVQLTTMSAPDTGSPSWSPDGKQIAFDSSASGRYGIYADDATGGAPRSLLVDSNLNVIPKWSRDGRWIYFQSDRGGTRQIWKMVSQGSPAIQITRNGGIVAHESLDGKFLYYTNRPYFSPIWRVSAQGEHPSVVIKKPVPEWNWTLARQGIYFVDTEGQTHPKLKYFSLATHELNTVATLEKSPWPHNQALALSPDSRFILFDQEENVNSDVVLVENFR
jgi:Tol biopolymer transport system component